MKYAGTKCKDCCLYLNQNRFSAGQLKKKASERKCILCVEKSTNSKSFYSERLMKWLAENGSEIKNVKIVEISDEHRGVVSSKRIEPNSPVIRISEKCMIFLNDLIESPMGQTLKKLNIGDHSLVALFLIQERYNPNSFWKPYIDMLPVKMKNFPVFYDDKEFENLKGSFTLHLIKTRFMAYEEEYEVIKNSNVTGFPFTFSEFVWGKIAVISRVFGIKRNDKTDSALVPVADMLNHDNEPGTSWAFNQENSTFDILSKKWILSGCPILDSYGYKCNSRYFVNYGFTLSNNEQNNSCDIYLPHNQLSEKQTALLGKPGNYDNGFSGYELLIQKNKDEILRNNFSRFQIPIFVAEPLRPNETDTSWKVIRRALQFSRIYVCSEEELPESVDIASTPLSEANEISALKFLGSACSARLNDFPTKLEEDEKALLSAEKFSSNYNILNMLISEKRTLKFYVDLGNVMREQNPNRALRADDRFKEYYKNQWLKLASAKN